MIIYRCDRCGAEHRHNGLVSNMQKQFGYEELSQPIDGVKDVCAACYKQVVDAWFKAEIKRREEKQSRFLALLGWTAP